MHGASAQGGQTAKHDLLVRRLRRRTVSSSESARKQGGAFEGSHLLIYRRSFRCVLPENDRVVEIGACISLVR